MGEISRMNEIRWSHVRVKSRDFMHEWNGVISHILCSLYYNNGMVYVDKILYVCDTEGYTDASPQWKQNKQSIAISNLLLSWKKVNALVIYPVESVTSYTMHNVLVHNTQMVYILIWTSILLIWTRGVDDNKFSEINLNY